MNLECPMMDNDQNEMEFIGIMEQYGREIVWLAYSYVKNE